MRWWLLLTIAASGAGCGTTATRGSVADDRVRRPLTKDASAEMAVEATDREPEDQPTVVVEATSPTDVRFRTDGETMVPLRRHRPITVISHRRGAGQGALIGCVVGVAAGLLSGASSQGSSDPDAVPLGPILGAALLGGVGTGLGAIAGAVIGQPVTVDPQ